MEIVIKKKKLFKVLNEVLSSESWAVFENMMEEKLCNNNFLKMRGTICLIPLFLQSHGVLSHLLHL